MDICKLRSIVPLLTAAVMVVSAARCLILDEPPSRVEVQLGSPLTLECRFKFKTQVRVEWYLRKSSLNNLCQNLSSKLYVNSLNDQETENTSVWEQQHAKKNDSGWYFCKVIQDIPRLCESASNGTEVVITAQSTNEGTAKALVTRKPEDQPALSGLVSDWRYIVIIGVACLVLLAAMIIVTLLVRRKRQRRKEEAIYVNTRRPPGLTSREPSPRPRVKMHNLKAVPVPASKDFMTPSPTRRQDRKLRTEP